LIIEPLAGHNRESFDSGNQILDDWLKRYSSQNERRGFSRTYVAVIDNVVAGYVSLATGDMDRDYVPLNIAKGAPRDVPVVVIGRLAVDQRAQGRGLGRNLLGFALQRALDVAQEVGVRAVVINAISERARDFYLSLAEFEWVAEQPLTLWVTIAEIKRSLA
jgi:GNAT superfamily N-acetyltransferase